MQLKLPEDMVAECKAAARVTLAASDGDELGPAIKHVWASKWGARALRACDQQRVSPSDVHMSVLVQNLICAKAAFVSHTRDPRSSSSNCIAEGPRMYIEAVVGLGEGLVSNLPGRPLAFTVNTAEMLLALRKPAAAGPAPTLSVLQAAEPRKMSVHAWLNSIPSDVILNALKSVAVEAASSKVWALHPEGYSSASQHERCTGLIARSASNMEDLGSFSGAGVFDSIGTWVSEASAAGTGFLGKGYVDVGLSMLQMALVTAEVAACLHGDQDVEGVLDVDEQVWVVQARPQV
jgi:hypothetical protein